MKILGSLVLVVMMGIMSACDKDEVVPNQEHYWNPQVCGAEFVDSANECNTEWNFYFNRTGFPSNVAIYINKTLLIDECNPNGKWVKQVNGGKVEFRLDHYSMIKKTDKISMKVVSLGDPCNTEAVDFIYHAKQDFTVSDDPNDSYVVIQN